MYRWNPDVTEDYAYCNNPERETISHLYLKGETAERVRIIIMEQLV